MMITTAQDSTLEDLIETTPAEVTHQTTGSNMMSPMSRGTDFYFQCAVLVVGIVGAGANGLVLYALVASKQHMKHVLIFNQNSLDFVNCFFLVVNYTIVLRNMYLSGTGGYWLCLTILSNAGTSAAYFGSMINLAALSIERYLKIVHHVWAKNKLRNWMIYSTLAFAWISGILIAVAGRIPSTSVVNGVCYSGVFFLSQTARKAHTIWDFLSFYVIILLIVIFCYGRILVVIRHQAKVMAAHSGQGSGITQDQLNKTQISIIKTMILVSGLFAITWAPVYIYILINNFSSEVMIDENGLYTVVSIAYLYICINPFIYATKFDPVKRVLLGLIPCKKNNVQESSADT